MRWWITSLTIINSTVYSCADQRKHQNSESLAFVWEIHRWPVNSPHKWPVMRKMFPFDDVIMSHENCYWYLLLRELDTSFEPGSPSTAVSSVLTTRPYIFIWVSPMYDWSHPRPRWSLCSIGQWLIIIIIYWSCINRSSNRLVIDCLSVDRLFKIEYESMNQLINQ